jgi:heme-degrading monooxygenase HmoA
MHARTLTIHVEAERIDEAAMLFEESVVPLCKQQGGYRGAIYLADRKNGQNVVITFWKSKEDMLANERNRFFQEQVSKFIGYFTAPPIREEYEVAFKDIS